MELVTYSPKKVKEVDWNFVNNIDKLYRMHGGLSSSLLSVEGGVAKLTVKVTERWKKEPGVTAQQIVTDRLLFDNRLYPVLLWEVKLLVFRKERQAKEDGLKEPVVYHFRIFSQDLFKD